MVKWIMGLMLGLNLQANSIDYKLEMVDNSELNTIYTVCMDNDAARDPGRVMAERIKYTFTKEELEAGALVACLAMGPGNSTDQNALLFIKEFNLLNNPGITNKEQMLKVAYIAISVFADVYYDLLINDGYSYETANATLYSHLAERTILFNVQKTLTAGGFISWVKTDLREFAYDIDNLIDKINPLE